MQRRVLDERQFSRIKSYQGRGWTAAQIQKRTGWSERVIRRVFKVGTYGAYKRHVAADHVAPVPAAEFMKTGTFKRSVMVASPNRQYAVAIIVWLLAASIFTVVLINSI